MEERKAAIREAELAARIEEDRSAFLHIAEQYRRGFLSDGERDRGFSAQLYRGFDCFLREKGLRFGLKEKNWDRFLGDLERWRRGEAPVPSQDCPWLLQGSEEAAASDKTGVFRLMDSLFYSPEFFKPIPEACVKPDIRIDGYGTYSMGMIIFCLADDGGLFRAADPVGKTYTLTDPRGLRAVLRIESVVTEQERARDNRISALFSAAGSVEGYTGSGERTIKVSAPDGKGRICLDAVMKGEDFRAFSDFPLWAEYRALESARAALAEAQLRRLTAYYSKSPKGLDP